MKYIYVIVFAGIMISCSSNNSAANSDSNPKDSTGGDQTAMDSSAFLVSYTDSAQDGNPLIGFKNPKGEIIIKAQYSYSMGDTLRQSIFVQGQEGWSMINKKGEVILKPYIFDNGPDYLAEGLFRFVDKNGKMGFADVGGNIVIPAQFDFVEPFGEDGTTKYYLGGAPEKNVEYPRWVGATEQGKIDKTGKKLNK